MTAADAGRVAILMGLFNGGRFLMDQLDSIRAQDHENWTLTISDDGSQDDGPALAAGFASSCPDGRVTLTFGPQRGFSHNFLSLLRHDRAAEAEYVALCDQDDRWFPNRLSRGVAALRAHGSAPVLYCARTIVCDAALHPLHASPLWPRRFGLRNALVQNVASGNTIVLNRAMADLARAAAPAAAQAGIVAHDWWLYQLACACGARVVQDDQPVLFYRQHARNTMGRNDTLAARLGRVRQVLDGTFARWIDANLSALSPLPDLTEEARTMLAAMPGLRGPGAVRRLQALRQIGLYRQEKLGNLAIILAALSRNI